MNEQEQVFETVDINQVNEVHQPQQPEIEVRDLDAPPVEEPTEEIEVPVETPEEAANKFPEPVNEEEPIKVEKIIDEVPANTNEGTIEKVQPSETKRETRSYPEGIDKLVSFMEETGGTLEDYNKLNRDISKLDDVSVVKEYYKEKHPHLDNEDITFKMNEQFLFDEDEDDDRAIRSKKLAFKEELYNAKNFLEQRKDKYYNELKTNRVSSDQNSAESQERFKNDFQTKTNEFFGEEFKGIELDLGEGVDNAIYRVGDVNKVREAHLNPNNVLGKYFEEGLLTDAKGYHKSLYFAQNGEMIARRMYEQGKADAIAERARESKQIDLKSQNKPAASNASRPGQFEKVQQRQSPNRLSVNKRFLPKK